MSRSSCFGYESNEIMRFLSQCGINKPIRDYFDFDLCALHMAYLPLTQSCKWVSLLLT